MEPGPPPEPEDVVDVAPPPDDRGPSPYRGGVDPGGRVPPYSLEAEVSVLGAAMLSRSAASEVTELLKPDDFYRSAHATVFEAVQELVAKGDAVDTVTVLEWVAARGRLDEIGGPSAVAELTAAVPTAANAAHYARIVHDKALLRRLIEAGTTVTRLGYEATEDARAAVDRAEAEIFKVAEHGTKTDYSVLKDLLNESFERIEKLATDSSEVTGLATGFNDLDRLTAGLQPENLIILAARPAMGKCVTGDTRVLLTDGRSLPIAEVVELGRAGKPIDVLSLDGDGVLRESNVTEFHDNGEREVVRMVTRYGRALRATPDHPVLTPSGWRHVGDLQPGDLVASPRRLPVEGRDRASAAEVRLLGYLLGDGCLTDSVPMVTTASSAIEQEVRELAPAFGCEVVLAADRGTVRTLRLRSALRRVTAAQVAGIAGVSDATVGSVHRDDGVVAMGDATRRRVAEAIIATGCDGTRATNHLTAWLDELGLLGHDAHDKHVPEVVHRLPDDQIAEFLNRLYACDGSAWVAEEHGYFGISYTSVSERLARDVQHLLLRLGVIARLRARQVAYATPDGTRTRRPAFELEIRDAANVLRFLDHVGIFAKDEACGRVRAAAAARASHSNLDLLPQDVWDDVLRAKGDRAWADVSEATGRPRNHNWHVGARRPSRRLLAELAEALDDDGLRQLVCDDVLWDEVVSVDPAGRERVFDLTVPGDHCFVANDLVVHNSSLALNLAQYVTVKLKKPTILFSLEMSKIEIVNRMLSSEAGIDSNKIKTGRLEDADWRRLGDALGRLADAPLYIDDTASISMLEISAKCRRLKQRGGLNLVIVDYLQLMQSHRQIESRQQEVSEISRGLKMLAKDLGVPVIALSQLSRQPESRVDKRPQLADLRESGCLTRSTRLFRADDGRPVTFGELLDDDARDVPVWATDESGRLVPGRLTHAFPSGVKPTYRVRLASGTVVEATGNHPFRTWDGWTALDDLAIDDRVATARRLPAPIEPRAMDDDELVLLAHLLGDGTTVARQPVHYTSADEANLVAVSDAARRRFGITARRAPDGRSARTTQLYLPAPTRLTHGVRNPIAAWLDGLGCWDRRAHEKRLPAEVFSLPDDQVRRFLRHLWATDGCVSLTQDARGRPRVGLYYATSSPGLAQDVRLLLLRVDLRARVVTVPRAGGRDGFQVWLNGADQQRRFCEQVGCHGERGEVVEAIAAAIADRASNTNVDTLPHDAWDHARAARTERGMSERSFQAGLGMSYCGTTLYRATMSRERAGRVAAVLEDDRLAAAAQDDLFWDRIVEIEPLGEREVFDATVAGLHNFVAEGVVLHNSIEQDADIVGFIYRDEVYDEDTPDKGIAELIISKHRNGATRTIRLAFLNHLTKFANLASAPRTSGNDGPPMPPPPGGSPL